MSLIRVRKGVVLSISDTGSIQELRVEVDGEIQNAVNYPELTGAAVIGDKVILNTTAIYLGLGTGGRHFVIHIEGDDYSELNQKGHIMKLRYTPLQIKCLAVEEEDSPYHDIMVDADDLDHMPVVSASLHSMVPAIAGAIKLRSENAKIAYIMTDGAALPATFSRLIGQMKATGLVDTVITTGHAFGGDYEAVSLHSALIAARHVAGSTHGIVAMGPGIVGTGTPYGFTGVEQADAINAINNLGGSAFAVVRLSFSDNRDRHRGISHHSRTVLGRLTNTPAALAIPPLGSDERTLVQSQIEESGICRRHRVVYDVDASDALAYVQELGIRLTTMGRGLDKEKEFFMAAAGAGLLAASAVF